MNDLQTLRRDPDLVVLEGFHVVKHAVRFGAVVERVLAIDQEALGRLAAELAPDVAARIVELAEEVPAAALGRIVARVPRTGVVGFARRPAGTAATVAGLRRDAPCVLLEDPRDLGNVGACVRVAAAAGAAGVVTTGTRDPWSAEALRGSAGLHFALPVVHAQGAATDERLGCRPLVALHPAGAPLDPARLPDDGLLAFGTERDGLSDDLLARADAVVALPMRPGVSSLNLATSVSAALYAWRLSRQEPAGG